MLPQLLPDARRTAATRATCVARLEQRRQCRPPVAAPLALGGVGLAYLVAVVLNALRLYSSR